MCESDKSQGNCEGEIECRRAEGARCPENDKSAKMLRGRPRIYGKKDSRYDVCLVLTVLLEPDEWRVSTAPSVCVARR